MTDTLIPPINPTAFLSHSNIFSLVSIPPNIEEDFPRIKRYELFEFLSYLSDSFSHDQPFLLLNREWAVLVEREATATLNNLDIYTREEGKFLEPSILKTLLSGLMGLFEQFTLFGLVVGKFVNRDRLDTCLRKATKDFHRDALILDSHYEFNDPSLEILDPLPPSASLTENPECWPGIILWSKTGRTSFLPEFDLYGNESTPLYEFFESIRDPEHLDRVLEEYRSTQARRKTLLHLSDLHCGSKFALPNLNIRYAAP